VTDHPELLVTTFVEVADTLTADFDIVEFLTRLATRCVELFDLAAAGLLLSDGAGGVSVAASSDQRMELLERFEIQHDDGPCIDCFHRGELVRCDDLRAEVDRWPRFGPEALARGYGSVVALPLRLRTQVIGSLNLLRADTHSFPAADLGAAQALADVATIAILQHRAAQEQQLLTDQLQSALTSRVLVEQAKGVVAERAHLNMDQAFARLRRYARDRNQRLVDVARAIVDRRISADDVDS